MLEKILVPLDGSGLADRILHLVRRLLLRVDAQVVLLHVAPRGEAPTGARGHLEAIARGLQDQGAQATVRLVEGDPATGIVDAARELGAAIIAMSTHGRSGLPRFIRGSVAERVLRSAPVPVLLVNPFGPERNDELRLRRILVPLDGSGCSAEILPVARDVARLFGSELILFHAIPLAPLPVMGAVDAIPELSPVMTCEEALGLLERHARDLEGVRVRCKVGCGDPAVEVLDAAREEQVDMVAMTTHGKSGLSRWVFGSVAEHVIRQCRCTLLVQRTIPAPEGGTTQVRANRSEPAKSGA